MRSKSQVVRVSLLPPSHLAALAGMALCGAIHLFPMRASATDDAAAIRGLIKQTWETPTKVIDVEPIVTSGDHAVASWIQGERGGRALLLRKHGTWAVVLCSGDSLKTAANLVLANVPEDDARKLESDLSTAESRLSSEQRAKFSLFEGTVDMRGPVPPHKHH